MPIEFEKFKTVFKVIEEKNIKFVFLDFDNTLYLYPPCHQYALKKCYNEFCKLAKISYNEFVELYKKCGQEVKKQTENQAACHSRLLYFQKMFESVYGRTNPQKALQFEKIYWQNFFQKMVIKPEVRNFLEELKKRKIKITLITDLTTEIQFKKILYLKLEKLVDFVVTSEEAGAEKPNRKIFNLALQKAGATKKASIYIGDDLKKDGAGGEGAGILTYIIKL
jgi:putative hydrolase of the HAD superfamily